MIARMLKAYVVARSQDRDRLLEALRGLGVVHLMPVDPARAVADTETVTARDRLQRAIQILEGTRPAGEPSALPASDAAQEALRIHRDSAELGHRLSALHRQVEQLAFWGDVRLEQFEALRQAGVEPKFFAVRTKEVPRIRAELVHVLGPWPGRRSLVAVIDRTGQAELPEVAEPLFLPQADRPALRAEAAKIDATLRQDAETMAGLAHLVPALRRERAKLRREAQWTIATRSALADEHLYALQGWVPQDRAAALAAGLDAAGLDVAVQTCEPAPGEEPPTLIQYAWWTRPMKGLFEILGTVPGYAEFDVSTMFMIFLPIFSAILISDTGYGLAYLVLPIVFYRRMAARGLQALAHLVMVIGAFSVVWGFLTCSLFGVDYSALVGRARPFIAVNMQKQSMDALMLISITLGAIHLSLAHLWKAKARFPGLAFLSEAGWALWLWGMYGVVLYFLLKAPFDFHTFPYYPYLLIVGGALAILFAAPDRNPLKMLGLGLANFPLSAIGTFGDTVSYVRLMAIGLAASALAVAFNDMAKGLPLPAAIPVLAAGHAINVALSIIALFAHGVRLNMLEFSNNLGMQWSGYSYEPFSQSHGEEN
jgi:V/A-type H+-transporting ATPase subunit I